MKTKQTIKFFLEAIDKSRRFALLVFSLAVSAIGVGLYIPVLYKHFFNLLSGLGSGPATGVITALGSVLIWILGANVIRAILWGIAAIASNSFSTRTAQTITNQCFDHLQQHSYGFISSSRIGALVQKVNRFTRAFDQLYEECIFKWLPLIVEFCTILGIMLWKSPLIAGILSIWTLIFIGLSYMFARYKLQYDLACSQARTKVSGQLADSITNHRAIKLFSTEEFESDEFKKVTGDQAQIKLFAWNIGEMFGIIQSLLIIVLEFFIWYYAIKLWQQGLFSLGDFVLLQAYLIVLFKKLIDFQRLFRNIFKHLAHAQEMTTILSAKPEVRDLKHAHELTMGNGSISFNNIHFGYRKDQEVIRNINLTIKPGEKIAFVGSSGSGKSTLIKLLLRFYSLNKGSITIDNQNITQVTQESLRQQISLVPQEPILFHRSIMENIRYGRLEATDEEVMHAAKLANCFDFISQMPEGFDELVGERGTSLSGGQRQRIAIARAILKNAPILVLDEATSSLDAQTECLIQDALETLMDNKTVIIVAHRLATIKNADRIIALRDGKIIEEGSHQKLLTKNGYYKKLWNLQQLSDPTLTNTPQSNFSLGLQ